jgi:UDP-glucose 4-epimerase
LRVAISGAGGLLGNAIARVLRQNGHELVLLSSSLKTSDLGEVRAWDAGWTWRQSADSLAEVDAVVHSAAYIPADPLSPEEASKCFDVNALGTLGLMRASEHAGVRQFVFISGANILKTRKRPVREDDPIGCEHSPYYLGSKVLAEIYVQSFRGVRTSPLILRPSSIYGPGMKSGVLRHLADRLRQGLPVNLTGGGRFQADFIWRDDVAKAVATGVERKVLGTINLGSGKATSILQIARTMARILHADPKLINVESSGTLNKGFSAVDIALAKRLLEFRPISVNEGLKRWLAST